MPKPPPNDSRLALAYGYLSHAAADIWAHTYVNEYSGDIFTLTDGETTVERRHVLLESLIAKATPQLRDNSNNVLGNYYDESIYSIDTAAVRSSLIYDRDAASQYWLQKTGAHLAIISKLRTNLPRRRIT